ncbi:polyprenyl synthetase family protein [Holophaga foetida]|uniref:polyprenyl synthetase family protein n=1 Tax=Holophaga foetida TaxID=35839 RepID=UPI0002472F2C|nr:farnesyl diphosphate synthase [Holophaga foetida]
MKLNSSDQVRSDLERLLPLFDAAYLKPFESGEAPGLAEAMCYSLRAGGKRVRPVLCMLAAECVGGSAEDALVCGLALEYIHTYSLVHDDLPAMDDDDLRRGQPTNHKVYGEGQAILAGDGLLTEAFQVLASASSLSADCRVELVSILAEAAGWRGMVGGQSLDLAGEILTRSGESYGLDHLQLIHRLKTGALLRASLEMGAVAAGADPGSRKALRAAGAAMGLAFQIQDDLLDETSTDEQMGKRVNKDQGRGKITYPMLLGMDGARLALTEATEQAITLLKPLPHPEALIAWAHFMAERTS